MNDRTEEADKRVTRAYWKYASITNAMALTDTQEIWPTDEDEDLLVMGDLMEIGELTGGQIIDFQHSKRSEDATGLIFLVRLPKTVRELYNEITDAYENSLRAQALIEASEFFAKTGEDVVSLILDEMSINALSGEELYTTEHDDEGYDESPRECGTIMFHIFR